MIAKLASMEGQDLRTPFMGGTKFPTDDSKQPAENLLEHSQHAAEVGAAPSLSKLKPKGPTLQEVSVKMPHATGSLPNIGESKYAMAMRTDPLVLYLKKQAEQLRTNLDEMISAHPEEPEMSSAPPQMTKEYAARALRQEDAILEYYFGNKPAE